MDKNKIKSFAVWARRNLIEAVRDRAYKIGISENGIEDIEIVQGGFKLKSKEEIFNLSSKDRNNLIKEIEEKCFEQVMEEIAYTWFNRFIAIRYMEVNDYLPIGIRILSSEIKEKTEPDVLTRISEVIDELNLDSEYIYGLLDSGKAEDRENVYKYILVRQCNELGNIIPQMFEKISNYTELLLPDNLLEEGSFIRRMAEDIEEGCFQEEVEIIGWMYQYYISEKKEKVFEDLKSNVKITKENIPAATQLFTPKWIVKYMVENSLGRLWLEKLKLEGGNSEQGIVHSKRLREKWNYYLEETERELETKEQTNEVTYKYGNIIPENIKVLDPCMGSGHILVYAFDVFYEIYKAAGYSEREIPRKILENNLYGLDIDDRAAQLASFALIMKARSYNRRLFREIEKEQIELNLCSIQESNEITKEVIDYFVGQKEELRKPVEHLVDTFVNAKVYGSILRVNNIDFNALEKRIEEIKDIEDEDFFSIGYRNVVLREMTRIIKQGKLMSRKYEVVVTNPPYIGNKGINNELKSYISKNFPNVKSDLFSVFIERNYDFAKEEGHLGFMTPFVWMFISSYEKLREKMVKEKSITSLVQLEYSGFSEATVPVCAFTLRNLSSSQKGEYIRLSDFKGSENQPIKTLEAIENPEVYYRYRISTKDFLSVPSYSIAYWISDKVKTLFSSNKVDKYADSCTGMQTGNNEKFTRFWYEVEIDKTNILSQSVNYKWNMYNEGGNLLKWYGNHLSVVNWENNGEEIRKNKSSVIRNEKYYYKEGITWKRIGSAGIALRYLPPNFIFDQSGDSMFLKDPDNLKYFLAYFNSKVAEVFFKVFSPTLNLTAGNINNFPIVFPPDIELKEHISKLASDCISIAKTNWDCFENSWDFETHPLLWINRDKQKKFPITTLVSDAFNEWKLFSDKQFEQLKYKEEELNRIFINIYGLQNELTPELEDKDITFRKADREADIKSFISYAVGCMFGRYSIDREGVVYAGGDWKDKWSLNIKKSIFKREEGLVGKVTKDGYKNIEGDTWSESSFITDNDNVIPITDDKYFEDDIVSKFIDFVKIIYGEDTLEENLDFIADSIGRKSSETSRQVIRRYFLKDFYKDHIKVYQKRPIYWLLESGKKDGFKALLYIHRYNEQTIAKVRTEYLHLLQRKYEAEISRLQLVVQSENYTDREKVFAKKKIDKISKQIEECREYDQVVAHLANGNISIDLDDGVKFNYAKFQGVKVINSKGKEVKIDLLAKI